MEFASCLSLPILMMSTFNKTPFLETLLAFAKVSTLPWKAAEYVSMEENERVQAIRRPVVRFASQLVKLRKIAPAAWLLCLTWQRRQWQKQTELQVSAVREGHGAVLRAFGNDLLIVVC